MIILLFLSTSCLHKPLQIFTVPSEIRIPTKEEIEDGREEHTIVQTL